LFQTKFSFFRFGVVYGSLGDRKMAFFHIGHRIIIKTTIQQSLHILQAGNPVQLFQVTTHQLANGTIDSLGVLWINVFAH
ncbi:hypothetical protein, partial [Pararhodospirillum oryzae]|uniref:hypothetical protein n=1 Tax=Pararhodospirillum oryzae TaxID=478448 RepID=UPI001C3FE60F